MPVPDALGFIAMKWEGVFCALWTPTDAHGELIAADVSSNIGFLEQRGTNGLLVLGSTGEFPLLEISIRKRCLEAARDSARKLVVVANISDVRPRIVHELAQFAKQIRCDAVALLPPYFYTVSQADMTEFFVRAAEAARLPLFLYNFPERTGNRISLETIGAVADRVPLAGVKQSGAEFDYHRALVQLGREKNFVVFTGSDTHLPEAMLMGVSGCVSGLSNAVPDLVVEIFQACRSGNPAVASTAIERMRQVGELIETVEFPMNVAAIMEARGRPTGMPKTIVSEKTAGRQRQLCENLKNLFQSWKLI